MKSGKRRQGLSRRELMVAGSSTLLAGLGFQELNANHAEANPNSVGTPITGDQALQKLMQGNQRHLAGKAKHPEYTLTRLQEVAKGQKPFAIILGCADSRVPPELLFDQGLGSLFVIRVAGNIVDDSVLGSMEYAAAELKAPLIMVLGHERCGAVNATLTGGELPGHIGKLAEAIKPALARMKKSPGDALDDAVRANVQWVVEQIKSSQPILSNLHAEKKLKIVGARYDLDEGRVTIVA
ncbi:MAG: carbonic anhydrase [Leptolyngbyaceae cyanobacterium bins.59]|nr:carbonic anhydrase [Leptolyngbyaceae cyanobacterium bins.59]